MSATTTVLHVDDDTEFLELSSSVLTGEGRFEVTTAESATEGFARLSEGGIDCVVSDSVRLPDGGAFVSAVGREYPDVPLILFTARDVSTVADELRGESVTEYVRKAGTNDFETLLAHLSRVAGDSIPFDVVGDTATTPDDRTADRGDTTVDADEASDLSARLPDLGPEWTVVGLHDWEDPEELTTAVVTAMAGLTDTEIEELPSLYHEVDPEAVAAVVCPRSDESSRHGVQVMFPYVGHDCLVTGCGAVAVRESSDTEGASSRQSSQRSGRPPSVSDRADASGPRSSPSSRSANDSTR